MFRTIAIGVFVLADLLLFAGTGRSQTILQQPVIPAPQPEVIPLMPTAPVMVVRPMTVGEFLAGFQPIGGNYEVVLLHPRTQCPVKVCFSLPPGCPKKVRYRCNEIEFDYGRREVEIRFKRDGGVVVDYD
jgi:hypothetical protein